MSDLTKGEVAVVLAGSTRILKPSLDAFSRLAARYETHPKLHEKLMAGDIAAMLAVLRYGLKMSDKEAKSLPNLIFMTGAHALIDPLVDYAFKLFNGGLSAEEWLAQQTGGQEAAGVAEGGDDENPLLAGG